MGDRDFRIVVHMPEMALPRGRQVVDVRLGQRVGKQLRIEVLANVLGLGRGVKIKMDFTKHSILPFSGLEVKGPAAEIPPERRRGRE